MHQLADDEAQRYPLVAKRLKEDCYTDNVMTSAAPKSKAMKLQKQMDLMKIRGFWKVLLRN